jgi:hypothetical protein
MFQPSDSKLLSVAVGSWQISYEGKRILSLLSLTTRDNDFVPLIYIMVRNYNSWNTKHSVLDTSSRCPSIQSDLNNAIFTWEKINFKWNIVADRNKWSTTQRLVNFYGTMHSNYTASKQILFRKIITNFSEEQMKDLRNCVTTSKCRDLIYY